MAAEAGLAVGSRVTVYCEDYDQWYKGTVGSLSDRSANRVFVVYDDYDENDGSWMNIMKSNWKRTAKRLEPLEVATAIAQKEERIKSLTVGTRVSVWWPAEKKFFSGRVGKIARPSKEKERTNPKRHYILYDDGDEQWINLFHCKFQITVSNKPKDNKPQYAATIREEPKEDPIQDIAKGPSDSPEEEPRDNESTESSEPIHDFRVGAEGSFKETQEELAKKKEIIRTLTIGSRVSVLWPLEKKYFSGTLTKIIPLPKKREYTGLKRHLIQYDDGDKGWTNLFHCKFEPIQPRGNNHPSKAVMIEEETSQEEERCPTKKDIIAKLTIGSRISVWWPLEKQSYAGTVEEIVFRRSKRQKISGKTLHYICYDDGHKRWTNLFQCKFELMAQPADTEPRLRPKHGGSVEKEMEDHIARKEALIQELVVGSRVSVWWPLEKQSFPGTLAKILPLSKKQEQISNKRHLIQYDDGDERWMNLLHCKFQLLQATESNDHQVGASEPTESAATEVTCPLCHHGVSVFDPTQADAKLAEHMAECQKESLHPRRCRRQKSSTEDKERELEKKEELIGKLTVGSRVSVWWPMEKQSFLGTLIEIVVPQSKQEQHTSKSLHCIRYDGGEECWTNLFHCEFQPIDNHLSVSASSSVGSTAEKISTAGMESTANVLPGGSSEERGNLAAATKARASCERLGNPEQLSSSGNQTKMSSKGSKKRRVQFLLQPVDPGTPNRKPKRAKLSGGDKKKHGRATFEDFCGICESPAIRPRATGCHHIFCKRCIKSHFKINQRSNLTCPRCDFEILKVTVKYSPSHASFRAVQALRMTTGEVAATYMSASAASLESPALLPSSIVKACQAKRPEKHEYEGFYWCFKGNKDKRLLVEKVKVEHS